MIIFILSSNSNMFSSMKLFVFKQRKIVDVIKIIEYKEK